MQLTLKFIFIDFPPKNRETIKIWININMNATQTEIKKKVKETY